LNSFFSFFSVKSNGNDLSSSNGYSCLLWLIGKFFGSFTGNGLRRTSCFSGSLALVLTLSSQVSIGLQAGKGFIDK